MKRFKEKSSLKIPRGVTSGAVGSTGRNLQAFSFERRDKRLRMEKGRAPGQHREVILRLLAKHRSRNRGLPVTSYHGEPLRNKGDSAMELKKGDGVELLPVEGVRPGWVGKRAVVQETFSKDGVGILYLYIWGEGSGIFFETQVRPIQGGIFGGSHAEVGKNGR
jgi:hypothetical protein